MPELEYIEWVESLPLGPPSPTKEENRVESSQFHHWKGVGWNTHVIIQNKKHNHHSIGLFLGYSSTKLLPKDWNINIKCTYTLLADDDKPLYTCKEIHYHFKNEGVEHERVGSVNVVDFEGLCELSHHYATVVSNFRVHTRIEEVADSHHHTHSHSEAKKRRLASPVSHDDIVSDHDDEHKKSSAFNSPDNSDTEKDEEKRNNNKIEKLAKIIVSPSQAVNVKAEAARRLKRLLTAY